MSDDTPEPERDPDLAALEDAERELAALEAELDTVETAAPDQQGRDDTREA